jgi:cell division transport system permease protein
MRSHPWLERHAQTLMGSLGRLVQTPLATLMTMTVIGIALLLPLLLHVFLSNIRDATAGWNRAIEISVYLDKRAGTARAHAIAKQLRARSDVSAVRVITADEALAEFRSASGFGIALDALSDNPLPDTLVVTPVLAAGKPAAAGGKSDDLAALQAAIGAIADVQTVQLDTQWVGRFQGMMDMVRRLVWLTAVVLGAGIILVIGNTIRLDILNRRGEIEVMKLVGATDAFARRPFLYSGVWYGFGGGLLALALCAAAVGILARPVADLAGLYGSPFRLRGLGLAHGTEVLVMAAALGWLGSWLAATRHIRRIAPS